MSFANDKPGVTISVTIGLFNQEDFESLKEQLEPDFRVGGGAAFELSEAEVARIVIEFAISTLQAVPPALLTSALYDGLKALIRKAKDTTPKYRTVFEFKIVGEDISSITGGKKYVYARLETDDEELVRKGLENLKEIAKPELQEERFEIDPRTGQWKKRKQQ